MKAIYNLNTGKLITLSNKIVAGFGCFFVIDDQNNHISYSNNEYAYLDASDLDISIYSLDRYIVEDGAIVINLDLLKSEKIAKSKTKLADYLATTPLVWTDGKSYSVTKEKQSLLANQISLYDLARSINQDYELRWNATGEASTVWKIEDLSALALAISNYVQPLVAFQQAMEVAINGCTTVEELDAIRIDYAALYAVNMTSYEVGSEEPVPVAVKKK